MIVQVGAVLRKTVVGCSNWSLYDAIVVDTCGLHDFDIDWDSAQCLTYTAPTIFND